MKEDDFIRAVKSHSNRLYLIALSYTESHYDSEDIVQDVFMKLWNKKTDFIDDEHLAKWLTVICINKSKDYLRTSFLRRNRPIEDAANLYTFDTEKDFELFNSVMKLPVKERVVIHMFYYEEMSVDEISKALNISKSSVKTRLHRSRKKLKELLGEDEAYDQ